MSAAKPVVEADPDNKSTTYTYDALGNRVSQTDANGNTTAYEYNYSAIGCASFLSASFELVNFRGGIRL